jgi:hypothetical protein
VITTGGECGGNVMNFALVVEREKKRKLLAAMSMINER